MRDRLVAAETEESDISREVSKAEADVQAVRDRAVRDQTRLDNGTVGSAKELEYHALLARDVGFLDPEDYQRLIGLVVETQRMLAALLRRSRAPSS